MVAWPAPVDAAVGLVGAPGGWAPTRMSRMPWVRGLSPLAGLVAVTRYMPGVAGAVYRPLLVMVPPALATLQVTAWIGLRWTTADSCNVPPGLTAAGWGLMTTPINGPPALASGTTVSNS